MDKPAHLRVNALLRRERLLRGWSQPDLARQLGITVVTVNRWERGIQQPTPMFRLKLCQLFNKSAEELGLLGDEAEKRLIQEDNSIDLPRNSSSVEIPETLPQSSNFSPSLRLLEQAFGQQDTTNVQTQISSELSLAQTIEASTEEVHKQSQHKKKAVSRRSLIVGGAGAITMLGGGLWWYFTVYHSVASVRSHPQTHPTELRLFSLYTYQAPPPLYINDVSWSAQELMIACAVGNGTVQIHQADTGGVSLVYHGHKGYVNCSQWQPQSNRCVASGGSDTTVQIWDALTNHTQYIYRHHTKSILYLAWSRDGTRIASGSSDTTVHVWDAFTGDTITIYRGHTGRVWSIRWAPNGNSVVSAGEDGRLHVWDAYTAKPSETFVYTETNNSTINEVDWSPDGRWISSAHADSKVYLWDASTGGRVLTYDRHTAPVRTARWAPDGKHIASAGDDQTIHIWDTTGQTLLTTKQNTSDILAVNWSTDGKYLASASKDGSLHVNLLQ